MTEHVQRIDRPDGASLILGAYRDRLFQKHAAQAAKEIEFLSEKGEYMMLEKDEGGLRIAASPEDGYLYAECLAQSFGTDALLFVESLGSDLFYVMAAKKRRVVEDRLCRASELRDVLSAHLLSGVDVRLSGNVPIAPQDTADNDARIITIPTASIASWQDAGPDYRFAVSLTPAAKLRLWKSVHAALFWPHRIVTLAVGLLIAGIIAGLLWLKAKNDDEGRRRATVAMDPLAQPYQRWASGVSLSQAMAEMARAALEAEGMFSASHTSSIKLEGAALSVDVEPKPDAPSNLALLSAAFRGRETAPLANSRATRISWRIVSTARRRDDFQRVVANTDRRYMMMELSWVETGPWEFRIVHQPIEQGLGFAFAGEQLTAARISPLALASAANTLDPSLANSVVTKAEYRPATGEAMFTFSLLFR